MVCHVVRREHQEPIRRACRKQIEGIKSEGRQRVRQRDGIVTEMQIMGITEENARQKHMQETRTWRQPLTHWRNAQKGRSAEAKIRSKAAFTLSVFSTRVVFDARRK